jgi:hypothetical protein
VDFIINTVLNRRLELIDVFSGDLLLAHAEAVRRLKRVVAVPVDREHDIVLTHAGYVGINHYQAAKAAVNALPILKEGGFLILAACERDTDPVGPLTYKTLLHLLKLHGPDAYLGLIMSPTWRFTRDQWEPQMWGKVLKQIGEEGLLYCSAALGPELQELVPGRLGWEFLPEGERGEGKETARRMTQAAIHHAVEHPRWTGRQPTMAFIADGPYAVPFLRPS